jgi:hypothetical protein
MGIVFFPFGYIVRDVHDFFINLAVDVGFSFDFIAFSGSFFTIFKLAGELYPTTYFVV